MLTTLLDFFCSRPFPERPNVLTRILTAVQAFLWIFIAAGVGIFLCGDFALPGENAQALAVFSGASPASTAAFPILWGLVTLFLGDAPSMGALNLFNSVIMGLTLAMTWHCVRFWAMDAMSEDASPRQKVWVAALTGHLVCAMFLLSLPGLYLTTGFTQILWCFFLLLLCCVLQNIYALNNGNRLLMILFAFLLGLATVESPWVLLFLPVFFLRAIAIEWRLWDHSVKNLPLWFITLVAGATALLIVNTLRITGELSPAGLWSSEAEVLRTHLNFFRTFFAGPWLIHAAVALFWPILAWITARRLLNNDRAWVLLITGIVLSLAGLAFFYGVERTPLHTWLASGLLPLATHWTVTMGCGMLTMGWAIQLFSKNPNIYEEIDRHHIPPYVTAMRVGGIFLFPISAIAIGAALVIHGMRFREVDTAMANRFADETIRLIAPDSESPAKAHSYLLGAAWIDLHLLLEARKQGVPLTLFMPSRAHDRYYTAALKHHLETDPLLGDADRLRLTHLLDYNFLVFVQDFFVSQPNAMQIAAAYDIADIWYAAKGRPLPYGTIYLGVDETDTAIDPLPNQQALQARWAETLQADKLPWWDITAATQRNIRHHLTFMANNLGTFLDDEGRLDEAANCYLYAHTTNKENISSLLNLYDICVRRGRLADRRVAVNRAFEDFLKERAKASRKYDLSAVGRLHGYIRNYDLFVQMGWDWAVSAAPESVLAGLRNAQSGLAPTDPRNAAVQAVVAAVYELQGQTQRSFDGYRAAVAANPKNVDALRGLARLSIQRGKVNEAGQWLAKAEAAGADQDALDIDRTAYLMAMGDLEGATKTIGRFTANHKDSAVGWAMLGMLEIEKGNTDRASGFILQNIKRTAQGRDIYFQHILEGRLAQAEAQKFQANSQDPKIASAIARQDAAKHARASWEEARRQYRRAYAIRPNVRNLLELILEFDRRLEDKAAAEADALAILREDTRHPYANFIVGSQRLEDGEIAAAVKYFRVAVEGEESPSADLLNNYADALSRTDRTDLAKEIGLRVVQLSPDTYASWGTYALALARGNEPAKAQTALTKAREVAKKQNQNIDPRLGFVDVWIALKLKDKSTAKAAYDAVRGGIGAAVSPLDKADFAAIEAALAQ